MMVVAGTPRQRNSSKLFVDVGLLHTLFITLVDMAPADASAGVRTEEETLRMGRLPLPRRRHTLYPTR